MRTVPDFPKPGVSFKDITPLLSDPDALRFAVERIADAFVGAEIDRVVGVEARGFILAPVVAYRLGAGFSPMRKEGKLPWESIGIDYELEYGTDRLELHCDGCAAGQRVLIIDDVLATGGTAQAAISLVEQTGAEVAGMAVLIELAFLGGREKLANYDLEAVLTYD